MFSRWKAILIIFIALGGGCWYWSQQAQETIAIPQVRTVEVARGDIRLAVSGSGQVEAVSQVDLKSVRAGDGVDVTRVLVNNNDHVKKGQVIAVLDSTDVARSLEQARLNLETAEIKLRQTNKTADTDTVEDKWSRQLQEIAVAQGRLSVADASEKLSDYTIRAPFDGIVTGLDIAAGDSLSNETVIASVITESMQVNITLNEVDAAKVAIGSSATLTLDALPGVVLTGKVTKIDTIGTVSQNVVSYGAEISLDKQSDRLKPGMSVTAEIVVAERQNVLLVPNEAITTEGGVTTVTVMSNSSHRTEATAERPKEKRVITTAVVGDTQTEVVSGLVEGEQIVTSLSSQTNRSNSEQNRNSSPSLMNLLRGGRSTGR